MSKQSFSLIFREALWKAHGQKCFYCKRGLLFAEMEVDHVIPETTLPNEVDDLKNRLGLPDSFDILGYENLAPACRDCNGGKRALPFADGTYMILLSRVAAKVTEIRQAVAKRQKHRTLDNILRSIEKELHSGTFSEEELQSGIAGITKLALIPSIPFSASEPKVMLYPTARQSIERAGMSLRQLAESIRHVRELGSIDGERIIGSGVSALRLNSRYRLFFRVVGKQVWIMGLVERVSQ